MNWPDYNTALKKRGSLTIWFDPAMCWTPQPSGRRGRQQAYSDAAIQTCLTMKVLFGMALRQTTGFVESLLELVGLDWPVPDFSTLCRRQKTLAVAIPFRGSAGPLDLLIDGTGIKAESEGEWHARKHGGPKRRIWRKIHLGIDEETLEIRAIEVTDNHIGDAPMLPGLLQQIPVDEEVASVTADGAYDTRKCHDAIADRGAHAVIPPRKMPSHGNQPLPGSCPKRSSASVKIPWRGALTKVERIPPPKPRRDEDALRQTAWSERDGPRLRSPSRRDPNPCSHPQRLHCARHTRNCCPCINPSGKGEFRPQADLCNKALWMRKALSTPIT